MEAFWFAGQVCTGTDPCFHPVRGPCCRRPVLYAVHTHRLEPRELVSALKHNHLVDTAKIWIRH